MARLGDNTAVVRLGALKVALNAEVDKISLLEKIGAFDETNHALNPESPQHSEEQSDAEDFRRFMKEVLKASDATGNENEPS